MSNTPAASAALPTPRDGRIRAAIERMDASGPLPGMIAAFEGVFGQAWTDPDWRQEASVWAMAWRRAVSVASAQQEAEQAPPAEALPHYYIGGPYADGRHSICETATGRVVRYLSPQQFAALTTEHAPSASDTREALADKLPAEIINEAVAELVDALGELNALVWGECRSLLDEDSGGNAQLALHISDLLAKHGQPQGGK